MNINYFKTFVTVVEEGSFSEAARLLKLSQPAISFQIQALEKHFAEPLLDRTGARIEPTAAGKVFLRFARKIVSLNQDLEEAIDQLREAVRGQLTLEASTIPGEHVVPKILGKFIERFPQIDLSLEISDTGKVIERIAEHRVDIGFVGAQPPKRFKNLKVERFATDTLVLVLPRDHPLATKSKVSIRDILDQPFILREEGSGTRRTFEQALKQAELSLDDLKIAMALGSNQAILAAVEAGLGVSVLSKWAVEKAEKLETVKTASVSDLDLKRDLYLVYNVGRPLSRAQQAFLELARELAPAF
jgi:DNA-binding transcriptional LysR family regulator